MPQSLEEPQSRANASQEAAQVATSNQTVNAFIGGRPHSWMTEGPFTNSNFVKISEIAPRKRIRPNKAPLSAPSLNDGNSSASIVPRTEQPTVPEAFRNQAVLPSPAPTDEPSPVISNQTDSPNQGPASYADTTANAPRSALEHNPRAPIVPALNTNLNAQAVGSPLGASDEFSTSYPPGTLAPLLVLRAMASASGINPSSQQAAAPWPSTPTGGTTTFPQVGQRAAPGPSATESRHKRMRLEHENPVAYASRDWMQTLTKHMEKYNGTRSLNDSVEIPRYKILRDACSIDDAFYVVLHQFFCGWSWDRPFVHNLLAPHVSCEAVDHAFAYLQVILRNNQVISPIHLEWFANFPGPLREFSLTSPQRSFMSVVGRFLHQLSTLWGQMMTSIEVRQFPLLVYEMQQNLSCTSPQMQSLLFTTSRRSLRIEDGPLATSLNDIFSKDKASEFQIATGQRTMQEVSQIRSGFAQRYVGIIQAFRQQQLSNQNNAPSPTMHGFAPGAYRNSIYLPAQQSPTLPRPHATLSSNSAVPSPVLVQSEAQIASRRASGPAVLGGSAPRGNMHVQSPHTSTWPHIASEPQTTQVSQNFVASPAQIHQPLTPGSTGALLPFPASGYMSQGLSSSRGVNSNSPAQGTQRRASSFQPPPPPPPQSTLTAPAVQGAPAYNSQGPGLQFPQHIMQPPNVRSMTQSPLDSGRSIQSWSSQHPNPGHSWPQTAPSALGYHAQPMASQHHAQRVPPPIQLASSHAPANHPAPGYIVPQSPGLVRPLSEMELHPNEYAVSPYGQPSLEMGLHQTGLRSPRRISSQLVQARYYQYVKQLETSPIQIKPQIALHTLRFNVPDETLQKLTPKKVTTGLPFCPYFEGSCRYRLRVCMRSDQRTEFDPGDWAVSACHWPMHMFIDANGCVMGLSRKQHFHKDMPLELTDALVAGYNTIRISLPLVDENKAKAGFKYFVAVELVETRSHASLRAMINSFKHTPAEETREKMIRRLRPSDSDDLIVEDETLLISLADPFSATMVETPVRGSKCLHLECFDLETWLQTRPSKPAQKGVGASETGPEPSMVDAWKCPICDLDARPTSLRIDEYFVQVRKELVGRGETNVKAITITATGEWTAVQEPDDSDDETPGPGQAKLTNGDGGKQRSVPVADVIEILDD
ncbi:hypothetical protein B0J13DRAFT_312732 [Dactylonectria estremocensis]|uniref:SP-RING-type domain-containing protein n=1 Tax=Dactylonectria estremocensis TaxID=1079267 RepID=A0A9P9F063_9HYPO|nr:hypothetical protein B0J13DRAFT_312732 [Dactylonectria estremocensis]